MSEARNTPTTTAFTHYEGEVPSGIVVEVGLDADQVSDVLDSERYADWHCSLRSRLRELVDAGRVSIQREYECTGSITLSFTVTDNVSADSEEDAHEVFGSHVEDNWQILVDVDSGDYFDTLDDVEVEVAEL